MKSIAFVILNIMILSLVCCSNVEKKNAGMSGRYKDSTGTVSVEFKEAEAIVTIAALPGTMEMPFTNKIPFNLDGDKIILHFQPGGMLVERDTQSHDVRKVKITLLAQVSDRVLTRNADGTLSGMGWVFTKE